MQQVSNDDFCAVCNDSHIQVARDGVYLVAVRAVHGGNSRKVLRLLHNSTTVAACHATTDGIHRNAGHIVEAIMAVTGDTLSVTCDDFVCQASTNFSILLLST